MDQPVRVRPIFVPWLLMIFLENMADIPVPFGMIFFQHDICMGFARGDNFL